jgi:hypothetical protein
MVAGVYFITKTYQLDLGVAYQPARMIAEISLATLSALLWVAATCGRAFVRVDFKADFCGQRQYKNLAVLIWHRVADTSSRANGAILFSTRAYHAEPSRVTSLPVSVG